MELIKLHLWLAFLADFSILWATELLPCRLHSEIRIPETDCGLVCAVQLIDVHVSERSFADHYILWGFKPSKSFGLCQFPLLQRKADRKCLCRWRRFLQGDSLCFCSVMASSSKLLTSCLGSMKHHFEYKEPFQDDLLHQNNWHKQRNIFWLPLFSGPMCAPISYVPLLNTQGNKSVGVNMYYLFV